MYLGFYTESFNKESGVLPFVENIMRNKLIKTSLELYLGYEGIDNEFVKKNFNPNTLYPKNISLLYMFLADNEINDDGAQIIGNYLSHFENIKDIGLSMNKSEFTKKSIFYLMKKVSEMKKLELLSLHFSKPKTILES